MKKGSDKCPLLALSLPLSKCARLLQDLADKAYHITVLSGGEHTSSCACKHEVLRQIRGT